MARLLMGMMVSLALFAPRASGQTAPAGDRPHVAIAAGSGVAFGSTAGAHLEILYQHVALFFGAGIDANMRGPWPGRWPSYSAGGRAFSGDRSGFFLSGAVAWLDFKQHGDLFTAEFMDWSDLFVSANAGYRALHHSGLFADLALGPAWLRERRSGFEAADPNTFCNSGSQAYSCQKTSWKLDVNIAVGFDF
jgi:hypothetical protein